MEPDNIVKQIREAAEKAASATSFPGMERVWAKVEEKLDEARPQPRLIPFRSKLAAAAAVVLLLGSASIYFLERQPATTGVARRETRPSAVRPVQQQAATARPPAGAESPVIVAAPAQPGGQVQTAIATSLPPAQSHMTGKVYPAYPVPAKEAAEEQATAQIFSGSASRPTGVYERFTALPEPTGKDPYGNVLVTDIAGALASENPVPSGAGSAPRIQVQRQFSIGDELLPFAQEPGGRPSPIIARMNPSPEEINDGVRSVTGRILDENGNGIPGVSISIKGASFSAVTDVAGGYAIRLPLEADTLIVAAMGADTAWVPLGKGSQLVVTLPSSPATMLASGGKQPSRNSYYRYHDNKLASRMINQMPVADIVRVLEDAVPGMEVVPGVSSPGGATQLRIGNTGADAPAASPLIVVDGKIHEGSLLIDPRMIRSFTFLKAQSGMAMYGARGANGVIVIATEKSSDAAGKGSRKGKL